MESKSKTPIFEKMVHIVYFLIAFPIFSIFALVIVFLIFREVYKDISPLLTESTVYNHIEIEGVSSEVVYQYIHEYLTNSAINDSFIKAEFESTGNVLKTMRTFFVVGEYKAKDYIDYPFVPEFLERRAAYVYEILMYYPEKASDTIRVDVKVTGDSIQYKGRAKNTSDTMPIFDTTFFDGLKEYLVKRVRGVPINERVVPIESIPIK